MTIKKHLPWAPVLAVTLVTGCAVRLPNPLGLPSASRPGAPEADVKQAGTEGLLPATPRGSLFFVIRWEEKATGYQTLAIPANAELTITITSKAGAVLAKKTMTHPGSGNVSTATFELDPAEGKVDVDVVARLSDNSTMSGRATDVLVRENTSTSLGITLAPDSKELAVRVKEHLAILKDLQGYADRFSSFLSYGNTDEVRRLQAALDEMSAFFKAPLPSSFQVNTAAALQDPVEATLTSPGAPGFSLSLNDGQPRTITWPGHSADYAYSTAAGTRNAKLTIGSNGGNGSTAELGTAISAGAWTDAPFLAFQLPVVFANTPGLRTLRYFGGQMPTQDTLSRQTVSVKVVPNGDAAYGASSTIALDDFRENPDIGNLLSFGYQQFYQQPIAGLLGLITGVAGLNAFGNLPGNTANDLIQPALMRANHWSTTTTAPSAAATTDFRVNPGMAFTLNSDVRLSGKKQAPTNFRIEVSGGPQNGPTPAGFSYAFTLSDLQANLKLKGQVRLAAGSLAPVITGTFYDIPSNTSVGSIELPLGADRNLRSGWPRLVLPGEQDILLTPGVISGESTGSVAVHVK